MFLCLSDSDVLLYIFNRGNWSFLTYKCCTYCHPLLSTIINAPFGNVILSIYSMVVCRSKDVSRGRGYWGSAPPPFWRTPKLHKEGKNSQFYPSREAFSPMRPDFPFPKCSLKRGLPLYLIVSTTTNLPNS